MSNKLVEQALADQDLLNFSKITTFEELREVLNAKRANLVSEINRLSFSTTPDQDKERTKLVAQFELINELIGRIK